MCRGAVIPADLSYLLGRLVALWLAYHGVVLCYAVLCYAMQCVPRPEAKKEKAERLKAEAAARESGKVRQTDRQIGTAFGTASVQQATATGGSSTWQQGHAAKRAGRAGAAATAGLLA